jgi:hypothetical protein
MTPSVIGRTLRQQEVERQELEEGQIWAGGDTYLSAAVNRHELCEEDRKRIDSNRDDEIKTEIAKENALGRILGDLENLVDSVWTFLFPTTSESLYGIAGLDYGSYWEDPKPTSMPTPPPKEIYKQLSAHELLMEKAEAIGEFHGKPVKALDLNSATDTWEDDDTALRTEYGKLYNEENGPCPPLELMEGYAVCEDRIVRRGTTTEAAGYDKHHEGKANHKGTLTVSTHNAVDNLKPATTNEAHQLTEEGAVILWNAGGSGKHFSMEYTQGVSA